MIMDQQSLEFFLEIATESVLAAGEVLEALYGKLNAIAEKGRPGDLVTEADQKAESVILEIIARNFPDHGILAEESGYLGNQNQNPYLWAIDPLDGTTNYAHGYPVACVSVGLMIEGIPQVGAIYNPFRRELFRAAKGLGATLNGNKIRVSEVATLNSSLLVSGFAYDRRETLDNNYAEFCHLTHLTQGVRRSGSAALDLTDVACGRLEGYWERGIKAWDVVAGVVILEEAGGKISAYDGSVLEIQSGRILATNGLIHTELSQSLIKSSDWFADFLGRSQIS